MTRYTAFIQDFSLALSTLAPAYCQSAAARFLVISDLHGANRLDLVRAILEAESAAGRDLSAVLVLGDLVNFGFPIELRLTRFRASLTRLQLPVLVILGNHDTHGPNDTSVARYLGRAPNVMMMQTRQAYRFAQFGPVSVGGFNDPRYFGDDNTGNAQKQRPAREAFLRAVAERGGVPDIVMIHEPAAASADPALWLNGHMHTPKIDPAGRRIQVGMFTDGMPYYNRNAHHRAPSNFVLLAARTPGDPTSVASVSFTWKRAIPSLTGIDSAEISPVGGTW